MIDTLKAAFVQGRLTKDEFDERVGRALVPLTYAELVALTDDIPAGLTEAARAGRQGWSGCERATPPRRACSRPWWQAW